MGDIKNIVIGIIITVIIGGTAYNISQSDIIKNFSDDTGLTQEQAEQYINETLEGDLFSFNEVGLEMVNDNQELLKVAQEIDCGNYWYEWESSTLSCSKGKTQLTKLARNAILLGQSYVKLDSDSSSKSDIKEAIRLIDQLNSDYQLEIASAILDQSEIDEIRKTNSYNKAILKTVLESD